jgi:hypothetical protein
VSQIFSSSFDGMVRTGAVVLGPLALCSVVGIFWYWGSPSYTDTGYQPTQPVPFSHKLHAGELGLDCRYCHSSVEISNQASVPATETCMNCHKMIKADSEALAPVRESFAKDVPVQWVRVHMLPDYAYFDHSVHVAAGVGCSTCHGRIDEMEVVTQYASLSMGWCLDCHRNPTPNLRPRDEVTNMAYDTATADYDPSTDLSRTRAVSPPEHCSGCHR